MVCKLMLQKCCGTSVYYKKKASNILLVQVGRIDNKITCIILEHSHELKYN